MRILLIGLMGSGKSTIGRRLSAQTGWPYLDNDTLLPELTGRTAPELIAEDGEDVLHAAEFAAFEHALEVPEPTIIGVAGWVVTVREGRAKLRDAGVVVWLRGRPETLRARAGTGQGRRPDALSAEWIRRTAAVREPMFTQVADLVIDVDRRRPRDIVELVLAVPELRATRATTSEPW